MDSNAELPALSKVKIARFISSYQHRNMPTIEYTEPRQYMLFETSSLTWAFAPGLHWGISASISRLRPQPRCFFIGHFTVLLSTQSTGDEFESLFVVAESLSFNDIPAVIYWTVNCKKAAEKLKQMTEKMNMRNHTHTNTIHECNEFRVRRVDFSWREIRQEAQLMLTTGSTRLAVSRGQQTWYHSTCYI